MLRRRVQVIIGIATFMAGALIWSQSSRYELPQDNGPDSLTVSNYPADIQQAYDLYANKCSKCHNLARSLNTTWVHDYWIRYIAIMQRKPASGITVEQAKVIMTFILYDQEHRKDKNPDKFFQPVTESGMSNMPAKKSA